MENYSFQEDFKVQQQRLSIKMTNQYVQRHLKQKSLKQELVVLRLMEKIFLEIFLRVLMQAVVYSAELLPQRALAYSEVDSSLHLLQLLQVLVYSREVVFLEGTPAHQGQFLALQQEDPSSQVVLLCSAVKILYSRYLLEAMLSQRKLKEKKVTMRMMKTLEKVMEVLQLLVLLIIKLLEVPLSRLN